ncbi:MAG TPA: hypothetical protein DEQ26_06435 [Flavobacteriaceae bacterium]|nr:hypothetical protein [Flavobacteriaceae bacterium]
MKKKLTFLIIVLSTTYTFSQVGVNTTTPSSTLDVSVKMNGSAIDNSQVYGLQAPRLTRAELAVTSGTTSKYGTNQKGAIVYITDVSGTDTGGSSTQRLNITTAGYYYFDGNIWQAISINSQEPWNVGGSTTPATRNSEAIYQTGYVGVGNFSGDTNSRGSLTNAFTIAGTGAANDDMLIESVSTNASSGQLNFKKSRGTYAAKTDVVAGDKIGEILFNGPSNSFGSLSVLAETPTTGYLMLGTSGTERMRITGSGDVGIGTATPSQKLDVSGNIRANSLTNGSSVISGDFGVYNQSNNWLRIATQGSDNGASGTSKIAFFTNATSSSPTGTNNTPAMVVDGGKVGIGTVSPTESLHVAGNVLGTGTATFQSLKTTSIPSTASIKSVVTDANTGTLYSRDIIEYKASNQNLANNASIQVTVPNGFYKVTVLGVNSCGHRAMSTFNIGGYSTIWAMLGSRQGTALIADQILPYSFTSTSSQITATHDDGPICAATGTSSGFQYQATLDSTGTLTITNKSGATKLFSVTATPI